MSTLQQVLTHLHAGRWNDAHNLVQSDSSELATNACKRTRPALPGPTDV